MAYDGKLKFDTGMDTSGFQKGISTLSSLAKSGLEGISSLASTGLSLVQSSIDATIDAMKGLGDVAVSFGKEAVTVGTNFEASLSKVIATAGMTKDSLVEITNADGITETVNMYDTLEAKSKELGASTQFSASQVSDAFGYMAMAGWDCNQMLGGIDGILNLAAASGEDLATTSDIVTDALTAFGLKAEDAGHFSDVLAKASSSANTNVSMMGETFKYVAPVAGSLGFNAEDCSVAIGLMANSGIKASQAGTSLRAIMTRLVKPTDDAYVAMQQLGLSVTNSDGTMKSFNEIMVDMRKSFANLSEAEKASYAALLGGQEAMSGLLAVVNASDSDFNKMNDAMYNCDGAAQKMAETVNDNLKGAWTTFKSATEGVQLAIYDNLENPLKKLTQNATGYMNEFNSAISSGGLVGGTSKIGDVLNSLLTDNSGIIQNAVETGTNMMLGLVKGIGANSQSISEAISTILTNGFSSGGSAFTGFYNLGIGMLTNIAQGISKNSKQIGKTVSNIVTSITTTLSNNVPTLLSSGITIISAIVSSIMDNLPMLLNMGINLLETILNGLISALPNILTFGITLITTLVDFIITNLPMLVEIGMQLIITLIEGLNQGLPTLIAMIPQIINSIIQIFMDNFGMIMELGVTLLVSICQAIAENLPMLITTIIELILYVIQVITENISTIFQAGVSILFALMDGIIQSLPMLIEQAPAIINAFCEEINGHLFELIAVAGALIVSLAQGLWDNRQLIIDNIKEILLMIWNIISMVNLASLGKNLLTSLKDGIMAMKGSLKSSIDDIINTIKTNLSSLPAKLKDIGVQMLLGLKDGFLSMVSSVGDDIFNAVFNIAQGLADFLGIHSPSRLMADMIGQYMPMGIAVGFDKETPNAIDDINKSLENSINGIKVDDINKSLENGINDIKVDDINKSLENDVNEIQIDDINRTLNSQITGIDIDGIYSQLKSLNYAQSVPSYSGVVQSAYKSSGETTQNDENNGNQGTIVVENYLFKNSQKLNSMVINAGVLENARSGGNSI